MMGRIDRHYELADGDHMRESTLFGYEDDPPIYRYMKHLATFIRDGAISSWRMTPIDSALVDAGRSIYCLGERGREYVIYFAAA